MHTSEPDHYAALGLDRRSTFAQIRAAYLLLTKEHHPDFHGNSPAAVKRAQKLNAAYAVLSDPARRRAYHRDLDAANAPAAAARARIERNISQDIHLRIEDLLRGTSLEVRVKDPANPDNTETYRLTIPALTPPNARFRLPRDEPFAGGFVQLRVKVLPGFRFKARGSDLRCELRIDNRRAMQGGNETMPGPSGNMLRVCIPSRVKRGEILRIAGEGLPKRGGGRGDLLVRVTYRPEVRVSRSTGR